MCKVFQRQPQVIWQSFGIVLHHNRTKARQRHNSAQQHKIQCFNVKVTDLDKESIWWASQCGRSDRRAFGSNRPTKVHEVKIFFSFAILKVILQSVIDRGITLFFIINKKLTNKKRLCWRIYFRVSPLPLFLRSDAKIRRIIELCKFLDNYFQAFKLI